MGFNYASAFLPPAPRPKFFPPFEGPVTGFTSIVDPTPMPELLCPEFIKGIPNKYPTKAEVDAWGKMFEASAMPVLNLRVWWINGFVELVRIINPSIGRIKALDWVASINGFPGSEAELRESLESGAIGELAERCAMELSKP